MVRKKTKSKAKKSTKSTKKKSTYKKSSSAKSTSKQASEQPVDIYETVNIPTLELEEYEPRIAEDDSVEDLNRGSTHYAWLGSGQCGGRLIKSFYELGYRKALAVNTTHHDLDLLELPKSQKFLMDIGEMGAGKDMTRGKEAVQRYRQEIIHLKGKIFGPNVNHIMVNFGAGGGTGSGSALNLVDIAKKYARHIGIENPDKRVGVILTLPTVGEASSPLVSHNTYQVVNELGQMAMEGKISPLIIIDNEKINKMYPGLTVKHFWSTINNTVAGLFDIFNRLSALSSDYTSFDTVDYHSIMEAGGCAIMGLTKVTEFKDKFALSTAVKNNLEKTLLANGFDLSTAKVAGCVVVGGRRLMENVPGLADNINYAFDVLSNITGKATVHRGIYEDNKDSLRAYTIIGGLELPHKRLAEFKL
ncbi:MAG: hypothetical protein PVH45_00165 [Candidatus Omnitrophota bacterium]|jgi:cell division GTPase FtsZ